MRVFTLTISNPNRPQRMNVLVYNTDKVTVSQIEKDIKNTLGVFHMSNSARKFYETSIKMAKEQTFKKLYRVRTKGDVRFFITASEVA